jgi:AraC-like DNA-binding protein
MTFRAWVDAFERLGYDAGRLLSEVGLERRGLDDPDALIPCAVVGDFVARTQRARPLQNLWTRLASETPVGAFPLLDYLILTADSVGDSCKQFARYVRLVGAPFVVDIRDDEDPVRVIYVMDPSVPASSVEYSVVLGVRFVSQEPERAVGFLYASFIHQPDDVSEIERVLGCPVQSNASWAGVAVARESWQVPLKRRDRVLRSLLEAQADAIATPQSGIGALGLAVRRTLASRLARGETDLDVVARDLGMSPRTLQRRLSAAGLSYVELCEGLRRETAEKHMRDPALAIGEIAYLAGYSEPAAFHRAFKRWTGITPQAFRERLRNRRPT